MERHDDREHALYAPSAMKRILTCTASLEMSIGIPEKSSSYAEEGTECHEAAADVLMGLPFDDVCRSRQLSDEQIDIVREYTDGVFDLIDLLHDKFDKPEIWIEERVRSSSNANYHGTADLFAFAGRTAEVRDLKAGFMPVLVRNEDGSLNEQLASYGVLGMDHHDLWNKVDKVRLTIHQPRVYDAPVTTVATIDELWEFRTRALKTFKRIEKKDTQIVPGDHCHFCPAKGRCPALRDKAVTSAKIAFDDPKPPRLYAPEELEEILLEAELIEAHINGIRSHVMRELEKGRAYKNFKLVPKRAVSKWSVDQDEIVNALFYAGLVETGDAMNIKLKSPAQIKKVLKKAGIEFNLEKLYKKESSGFTLARMDDPREAVNYDPFADPE